MSPTNYTALAAAAATLAAVLVLLRSVQSLRAEVETLKSKLVITTPSMTILDARRTRTTHKPAPDFHLQSEPPATDERGSAAQPPSKRVATNDGRRRVCIGCSGSVAAVKAAQLVLELIETHGESRTFEHGRAGAYTRCALDTALTGSAYALQGSMSTL